MKTKILPLLLLLGFLFGCAPKYLDIREQITRQEVPLPKYYFYNDVSWPSDHLIVFTYFPKFQISFVPDILSTYNISTNEMMDVQMPDQLPGCKRGWSPVSITVSPTKNLAFTAMCEPLSGSHLWMEYNLKTREFEQIFEDHSMLATRFSFIAADKVVQENSVGNPMSNELWMISLTSQTKTRILPDFLRASHPTWSPQKKLIAFWGTEKFPGGKPGDLYTFEEISKLVRYPWDLYVMDENGEQVKKIFPSVAQAWTLEWSPTHNLLAFSGIINDVPGIWLLDIDNPEPIRIFESPSLFTWSPDGKKLLVIEHKDPDQSNNNVPVNAYILKLPDCVFDHGCK
jgi:hypothetical protein